ncbi:hypothetical protein [Aureispira anguillae]|nr:hypothetical protein [Aureispira anguillae]
MYKSKLIEVFSSLSKPEQNRLRKFVHSPYHNKHDEVHRLLDYLMTHKSYRIKDAFDEIFPNRKYNPQKIRNTMSYLQKLIDKFLVYEALESEEALRNKALLSVYRTRKLEKCFKSSFKYSEFLLNKSQYKDTEYYYLDYELQQEQFLFAQEKKRLEAKNVQEVLDSFDIYYMTNKLKYCVTALSHQNVFSTTYELRMVEPILDQIEKEDWLEIPTIAVYYYSYKALTNLNDIEACMKLKTTFLEHSQLFRVEELKDFYLITISFFIKHLNLGREEFTKDIFDLYKAGLVDGIFVGDGQLSRFTYKNIVAAGLKYGDYEWVRQFISHYAPYLNIRHRESYTNYNMAKLYYMTQEYQKAMKMFMVLSNTDRELMMDSKVTLLKIYYELDEFDALESLLESFKAYVKRNKEVSDYLKRSYLNLIRYIQKLQNHNFYNKEVQAKLLEEIKNEPQLPERQWIISQLVD